MNLLTKKNVFILFFVSILGALTIYVLNNFCRANFQSLICETAASFPVILIPFALLFLLAFLLVPFLLTLPLKPSAFNAWKKFAVWVIPITFIATFALMFAPSGSGLGGFGGAFLLLLILIVYGLYLLISLIIIAFAWWKSRKG